MIGLRGDVFKLLAYRFRVGGQKERARGFPIPS